MKFQVIAIIKYSGRQITPSFWCEILALIYNFTREIITKFCMSQCQDSAKVLKCYECMKMSGHIKKDSIRYSVFGQVILKVRSLIQNLSSKPFGA